MAVYSKVTFGLALAGLLVGQTAFAEAPRASDPRLGSAQAGKVVGFRQSAKVARKNKDGSEVLIGGLALAAVVAGVVIAVGDDGNDNDLPASP